MNKISLFLFLCVFVCLQLPAQVCTLSGNVKDINTRKPIAGAAILIHNTDIGELSDNTGYFSFCHLDKKEYILSVEYMGYKSDTIRVNLKDSVTTLNIQLKPAEIALKEVVVTEVLVEVSADRTYVDRPDADFLKLVSTHPGVATMNIGAGVSKPVIRGLSANRVAVMNSGIIRQDQQWGADHGMEFNQFDVYRTTVYKGPYALLFGSSNPVMLEIEPLSIHNSCSEAPAFEGQANLWGASNNGQLGSAFSAKWQNKKWYIRGSYRYMTYNDYRVPAGEVTYQNEEIALPDKRVPNTAGKEQSFSGTVGYRINRNVITSVIVSNSYLKTGLFELGHDHEEEGHEHEGEEGHEHEGEGHDHEHEVADTSHKNIGMPYARSNHFSVTNNTAWNTSTSYLVANIGYQNSHRQEFEHFHEHYEGQPAPATDNNMSVDFGLKTYSSNVRLNWDKDEKWRKAIGANVEFQRNRVGGFEYFLPEYNQVTGGLSFVNTFEPVRTWLFEAGIRYDLAHIDITGFYDNTLAGYLQEQGYASDIVQQYAQRTYDVNRSSGSFSGNVGAVYRPDMDMEKGQLFFKLNLAKSLRFPAANELATNGIHHAAFRYEIGDPGLNPEHGYTVNFEMYYVRDRRGRKLEVLFNPFFTYYSNFIYLRQITDSPVELYEEQPYKYTQAKAIYGGGEYKVLWRPVEKLQLTTSGNLVLNRNIDDDKPLPFTPPFTMANEIKFLDDKRSRKDLSYYQLSLSHRWYADQNRVGVGEEKTKGCNLFDFSAGFVYKLGKKWSVDVNMQVKNMFNTRYLNHISLYRRLNIPEQGRSFQILVCIPFRS